MSGARIACVLALALAACAGTHAVAAPAAQHVHVVTIDGFAFKPPVVTVKAGDTIEWRNDDPVPHTATSTSGGFDSGSIAAGATYRWVARKPGRFDYLCTFHTIMKGTVVVE
jgi:plastocyanin